MKSKAAKLIPAFIAAAVISITCGLQIAFYFFPSFDFFQRLEWITYDWRMRQAAVYSQPPSRHLAAVFIDEPDLKYFNEEESYKFAFPWPRQLYGRLVKRLTEAGVKTVAFDILFIENHPDNPDTDFVTEDGKRIGSDEYFSQQLASAKNVILATSGETHGLKWKAVAPADLFRTNAVLGHIVGGADTDGVRRRAVPFRDDPELGRIWDMGVVLATKALEADLDKIVVEKSRIIIRGKQGERIIPLNRDGTFYIDWTLAWNDRHLAMDGFARVVEGISDIDWRNKLVVVGSIGSGNNISDIGATPISEMTYLVSKHWNVANSILTNQFIHPSSLGVNLVILLLFGAFSAVVTWKERTLVATFSVLAVIALYVAFALFVFMFGRYWIPLALPVTGALLSTHVCLLVHRVIFERDERQRVKAVFSKMVSPNIVNELLGKESIKLGGERREITILFSDVRGFTQMTDAVQAAAEEHVRKNNLPAAEAEEFYDSVAADSLRTVNTYLATISDIVKKYDGTVDKYIGDCVMAFWGAPTENEKHALLAVRAAVETQRTFEELNQQRAAENERRKAAGKSSELDMLPLLAMGCGINSGQAIVGLMGSNEHVLSYTVFGREVNIASRLEGVSGRSRVIISEATYLKVLRDDPNLAATCKELESVQVKGISKPVKIFEVPWKTAAAPVENKSQPAEVSTAPTVPPDSGKK